MKNASEENEDLYTLVFSELKKFGIKVPKVKKFKSNIAKQDRSFVENRNKVFGCSLCEQEWISEGGDPLPKFIAATTAYLRNYIDAEIGLFRKAGSVARQRELRNKVEKEIIFENCEPNDVASLLKQWLRELPEPVIPIYLHDLFVKCHGLECEEDRISAVLLCCLLLPSEHLYTLRHLLKFLLEIASNSDKNKMVPHNLAVVMAPNLLSCGCDRVDKAGSSRVQCYNSLVELLIVNADLVGQVPSKLTSLLTLKPGSHLDFPIESLDYSPSINRKKKRSGGVTGFGFSTDLVNGIRKFVGGNLTPINNCMDTTVENKDPVPRCASKRKADPDPQPFLDVKKRPLGESQSVDSSHSPVFTPIGRSRFVHSIVVPANGPTLNTPLSHIRRKSFGLLGKKKRKRVKPSTKPGSNSKEISPMLGVCRLPDDSLVPCIGVAPQNVLVPERSLLSVPMIQLSPVNLKDSPFQFHNKQVITRAHSDQPLTTKREVITRAISTSDECLPSRNIAVICLKKGRSGKLDPVQFKAKGPAKKRSPKTDQLSVPAPLSPAVLKKPEALASVGFEKPRIHRNSTIRRSCRRKMPPNQSGAKLVRSSSVKQNKPERPDLVGDSCAAPATQNSSLMVLNVDSDEKEDAGGDLLLRTPNSKRTTLKRGGNKSSLRRGRPNTVKTGLPSELCPKYSCDSISMKLDLSDPDVSSEKQHSADGSKLTENDIKQTTDVPTEVCIRLKESILETKKKKSIRKKSNTDSESAQPMVGDTNEKSENSKIEPSTPHAVAVSSEMKEDSQMISDSESSKAVPDSVGLNDSADFTVSHKARRSSTAANILTPAKITEEASGEDNVEHIDVAVPFEMKVDLPPDLSINEEWNSDPENFLDSEMLQADIPSCKRESIVQILKKNAGKVQANVSLYDRIAKPSPHSSSRKKPDIARSTSDCTTPSSNHKVLIERHRSTPRHKPLCVSQNKDNRSNMIRSESKSFRYKSPVPPPPKFFAYSTENVSSPLKEVTNLNNSLKDLKTVKGMSPVDKLKASPLLPRRRSSNLNKDESMKNGMPDGKSLGKARRSESSPALSQVRRLKSQANAGSSNAPKAIPAHSQSFNASHVYHSRPRARKSASKTSVCSNENVSFSQLLDEWQCDM